MPNAPNDPRKRVHLRIFGRDLDVEVPSPRGSSRVVDLWSAARTLTEAIGARVRETASEEGKRVTCSEGCGACCRQLVPVSTIEAKHLSEVVAALPAARKEALRARFASAVGRLEEEGLLPAGSGRAALVHDGTPGESPWENVSRRYGEAQIPCPFLEEERCSIYADRPMVCREFLATSSPRHCADRSPEITALPRPVRMGEALAAAAHTVAGVTRAQIPLTLALEWASHHGAKLTRSPPAQASLDALIAAIDVEDDAENA